MVSLFTEKLLLISSWNEELGLSVKEYVIPWVELIINFMVSNIQYFIMCIYTINGSVSFSDHPH